MSNIGFFMNTVNYVEDEENIDIQEFWAKLLRAPPPPPEKKLFYSDLKRVNGKLMWVRDGDSEGPRSEAGPSAAALTGGDAHPSAPVPSGSRDTASVAADFSPSVGPPPTSSSSDDAARHEAAESRRTSAAAPPTPRRGQSIDSQDVVGTALHGINMNDRGVLREDRTPSEGYRTEDEAPAAGRARSQEVVRSEAEERAATPPSYRRWYGRRRKVSKSGSSKSGKSRKR